MLNNQSEVSYLGMCVCGGGGWQLLITHSFSFSGRALFNFWFPCFSLIGVIMFHILFRQPDCWNFMIGAFQSLINDGLQQTSWSSGSYPSLLQYSLNLTWVQELCCWCIIWDWAPIGQLFSAFWLVLAFCDGLHLLPNECSLMRIES